MERRALCRGGEWAGGVCMQGPHHLHSPSSAGIPLWTLLQHAGDPGLQRGDEMKRGHSSGRLLRPS